MAAVSLFPQKALVGEDVTEKVAAGERTQLLQRAANLVRSIIISPITGLT